MSSGRDLDTRRVADLGVPGVRFTRVGLEIVDPLSLDDCEHIGFVLGKLRDATAFAIGDLFVFGEGEYGEAFAQVVEATGRSKTTVMEYVRVAGSVSRRRRRSCLSFTHHQLVAAREPAEQDELLDAAERNAWSVEEFRGALAGRLDPALSTRRIPIPEGDDRESPSASAPQSQLVIERPSLREVAAEIVNAERDKHGMVCVGSNLLERLRRALDEEPSP
jgi:hypothetical protein